MTSTPGPGTDPVSDPVPGLHTIGRWVADQARTCPDAIAVDDRGVGVSYAELDRRAHSLAWRLLGAGLRQGDRLATLTGNSADHVVVMFACAKAGLVLTPLSWRLTPRELAVQLEHALPALLLVEEELEPLARAALGRLVEAVPTTRLGVCGVEQELPVLRVDHGRGPAAPHAGLPAVGDDDPLFLLYTSGTSHAPRGAVLSHANCFWTTLAISRRLELSRHDVVLSVLPQFHVGAWTIQSMLAWWTGATVVLERTFDAGRALRLIEEKRVSTMMGVPANYLFLSQHPDFAAADLSSLRYAVVGGAPVPAPLLRAWHDRGVQLAQGYGLTEASPNVLCLAAEEAADRVGWAGRPYAHLDVAVADPVSGALLDGPATGELLVRGPSVFAGYWRDEAATAFATRGGWLHTGDLVERDTAGFYRVLDRLDDLYISGGENVSPAEIESVLFSHPAVADCAVVGRRDERWGEVGVAFVVVRAGVATDVVELTEHCRRELADYKVPREIRFVAELPRSHVGKVLRRTLRAGPADGAELEVPR